MRLGIDTFSLRSQGWTPFQIIDYAAGLGLDNVHFSERDHAGGIEESSLARVREYAGQHNLTLELGMRSFNQLSTTFVPALGTGEQQLIDMIGAAVTIGSPIVRCFAGMQQDRSGPDGFQAFFDEAVRVLRAAAPHAERAGIVIAVENHGGVDFLASELRQLIETVDSSHAGVCLDTGNPMYAGEDAVYAAEILAPYVVTCHLRDTLVWLTPDGAMAQWVPIGRGSLDIPHIVSILQATSRDIPLDLEEITGGAPRSIPFYDQNSQYWGRYPDMKAPALARFLATAQTGSAGPIEHLILPPSADQSASHIRQQLDHFEESLRFTKNALVSSDAF